MTKKKLMNLRPHDNNMYVHIRNLTGVRNVIPPLKNQDGTISYTSTDKATSLAKHFDSVHRQNDDMGEPAHDAHVLETVESFLSTSMEGQFAIETDVEEVKRIVRALRNHKAPGIDSIKSIVFKNLSLRALTFYTAIVNASFSLSYFPSS